MKSIHIRACCLLLCLLLAGFAAGCTAAPAVPVQSERLQIVATIFPPYDFARQLGGELVEVTMLAAPGTEAHDYVPSLAELNAIAQCDLFLYIGGETDAWAQDALDSLGDAAPASLALTELVSPVAACTLEGLQHDHDHDDHAPADETDEHVWTSPKNAMTICDGIAAALEQVDPDHAADYAANLSNYQAQLAKLAADFAAVMDGSVRQTVVFAERFPFRHLAAELGLTCYAAFEGCSSDTEPSLATMAFLTEKIQTEQLPVVFYIEFSTQTVADTLCTATGAEKLQLHSCHNVSQTDFDAGVTYLSLMQQNVENLRIALQ